MTIKFPKRGLHDNKPTPKTLYDIIIQELKFTDVCLDKDKFNAAVKLWTDRSYCNPPFSNKKIFITRAVTSHQILNSEILLYLPFDPTTSWFHLLYQHNVLIMVFMRRMLHAKFPHALYHLRNYTHTQVVLLREERDILTYVR